MAQAYWEKEIAGLCQARLAGRWEGIKIKNSGSSYASLINDNFLKQNTVFS